MQQEITEQWAEVIRNANRPLIALAELNARTFNRVARNFEGLDEVIGSKNLESGIEAQIKLASANNLELMRAAQEAYNIILNATTHMGRIFTDIAGETSHKAAEAVKTTVKGRRKGSR